MIPRSESRGRLSLVALSALALLCLTGVAHADRPNTDHVVLKNGDRITGEIKKLYHGILTVSTDAIGTISVEWDDVDSLSSPYTFRVEDESGGKRFGSIVLQRNDSLLVTQDTRASMLWKPNVVSISQLEARLWQQLEGSMSFGLTYTKANNLLQVSTNISVRRRTTYRILGIDANSIMTTQESEDPQRQQEVGVSYNRLFKGPLFATAVASEQSNDELGLDLRLQFAPGMGLYLVRSNRKELVAGAGLSVNREWSSEGNTDNLEAFFSGEYSSFSYDFPKGSLDARVVSYPSLSDWGRVRSEVDLAATHEIAPDVDLGLSYYDSYDNRPPDPTAAKHDYGLVLSVGWSF